MPSHTFASTHPGQKRTENEDAFWYDETRGLFLLSDGVGGQKGGEVASQKTIDFLKDYLQSPPPHSAIEMWLLKSIREASKALFQLSKKETKLKGMAATLTLLYFHAKVYYYINVGDSRGYLFRQQQLQQITHDHTVAFEVYWNGGISKEALHKHPNRSLLTRTLGKDIVVPDLFQGKIETGDLFLMCSDGLTGELQDAEIEKILQSSEDLEHLGNTLIQTANASGGKDNITLILTRV